MRTQGQQQSEKVDCRRVKKGMITNGTLIASGAHQILWIREHVTSYTSNNMGEIQTWRPVLLCI